MELEWPVRVGPDEWNSSSLSSTPRTSGFGRPAILAPMASGVEKPYSVEDSDLRLDPSPSATDDEIFSTTHGPRLRKGLCIVWGKFGEL